MNADIISIYKTKKLYSEQNNALFSLTRARTAKDDKYFKLTDHLTTALAYLDRPTGHRRLLPDRN